MYIRQQEIKSLQPVQSSEASKEGGRNICQLVVVDGPEHWVRHSPMDIDNQKLPKEAGHAEGYMKLV